MAALPPGLASTRPGGTGHVSPDPPRDTGRTRTAIDALCRRVPRPFGPGVMLVRRPWRDIARCRGAMLVPRPRTQGAPLASPKGATEDPVSGRAARPGDSAMFRRVLQTLERIRTSARGVEARCSVQAELRGQV